MSLYLCVDCGGSKTAVVICDASGAIVGRAHGGPSNYTYLGADAFINAVELTILAAIKALPSLPPIFAAAWFGIAGVDSPAAVSALTPLLSGLVSIPPGPRLIIANDTHLLAAPALLLHPDVGTAVAVIAGTGSNAVSFGRKGVDGVEEVARSGGWGWLLGDEGSGFDVGREAVRQILLEREIGSPPTPFTRKVLTHFGAKDESQMLANVYRMSGVSDALAMTMDREKRLSSLAPLVFASAFSDHLDPLALRVLQTCAAKLAESVSRLPAEAGERAVCFGGSLVGVEAYRNMVLDEIGRRGHVFRYVEVVQDPAEWGAKCLVRLFGE
jgi:N-acetylglucosamine kinase-like BadF-type ATPase